MSDSYLAQWIAKIDTGHVITEDDMATLARIRLALHSADKHHAQARAAQAETNRLATRVTWLENEIDMIDKIAVAATSLMNAPLDERELYIRKVIDAARTYRDGSLDDDGTEP